MNAPDPFEILSALFDGEPVDPDAVAAALAQPGAAEFLVDLARLRRRLAREDAALPVPAARPARSARRLLAAAAALLLFVAGAAAGRWLTRPGENLEPPTPTREVQFTPGVDWFRS